MAVFVLFRSFLQGFHVYKDVWNPAHIGEHFCHCATTATIHYLSEILNLFVLFRAGHLKINTLPIVPKYRASKNHVSPECPGNSNECS